jgi:sec-independent protein translocase protein TatA
MLGRIGLPELLLVLLIVLLLFGAKRLPEIARGLGRSIQEFKKGVKDVKDIGHDEHDVDDSRS